MFNRSLSRIFKYYINISNIKSSIYLSIKSLDKNISPLTMYHCVFGNLSTFFSGISRFFGNSDGSLHMPGMLMGDFQQAYGNFPQLSISQPQGNCEGGYYNSSGSADKAIVGLNPPTDKNGSIFKDDEERDYFIQGAFLISLVIVLIIFVIWYA